MMARKLSGIAWQGCTFLAIVTWLIAGDTAPAQESVQGHMQVSSPAHVVKNPFASGGDSQTMTVPDEPESPRQGVTMYQNPFAKSRTAKLQMAPPIALPARPGPISRWQRPSLVAEDSSSVRTAILDTAPTQFDPFLSSQMVRTTAPNGVNFGQPPDPIQFAPQTLAQPAWMTGDIESAGPLSHSLASAAEVPITVDAFNLPAQSLQSDTSNGAPDVAAIFDNAKAATDGSTPIASPKWLPYIVSDGGEARGDFYEQARLAADTAETIDQFSTAIDLCRRGLDNSPPQELATALRRLAAWAHNRRGELRGDNERQEALFDFQAAISLDPSSWNAIHNRGVTLAEQGDTSGALRDFNRVLEINPGITIAYRNRAELLASLGRMGEAVRDYSQALAKSPHDADLFRARGYAWQRLGDFDRALADLEASLRLEPEQPDAYTQCGNLAAEQGEFDGAIANYQHALEIDPHWAEAHRSLAWLWATCPNSRYRNANGALRAAKEALALAPPDDSFVLDAAAAAHANAGEFDKAIEFQQQALATAPPDILQSMRERLALYQQRKPFRSRATDSAVETASHLDGAKQPPQKQR